MSKWIRAVRFAIVATYKSLRYGAICAISYYQTCVLNAKYEATRQAKHAERQAILAEIANISQEAGEY